MFNGTWTWTINTTTTYTSGSVAELEPLCPPHPKKFMILKVDGVLCQRCGLKKPYPELKNNDATEEAENPV